MRRDVFDPGLRRDAHTHNQSNGYHCALRIVPQHAVDRVLQKSPWCSQGGCSCWAWAADGGRIGLILAALVDVGYMRHIYAMDQTYAIGG